MLQGHRLGEAVEQALPAAEHDRRDRDRQLVHIPGAERLADDVRPAHDGHVLGPSRLARSGDRLVQPVYEGEPGVRGRGVLGAVRHDEERHAERIAAAPGLGRFVGAPAADDGPVASDRPVEELLVRASRLTACAVLVTPRAAEDPVVQSLAALAQTAAWSVVRPGDVAVHRRRDSRDHLRHRPLLTWCHHHRSGRICKAKLIWTASSPARATIWTRYSSTRHRSERAEESIRVTGAILAGRRSYDVGRRDARKASGAQRRVVGEEPGHLPVRHHGLDDAGKEEPQDKGQQSHVMPAAMLRAWTMPPPKLAMRVPEAVTTICGVLR